MAPVEPLDPAGIVARWSQQVAERKGLRARLRLSVDSEAGDAGAPLHVRSRQRLALERPDRLQVVLLGPLRTAVAILVTDGSRYRLSWADGRIESGEVHGALLWELTGLDIDAAEAVDLLLGMPRLPEARGAKRTFALPGGGIRVELLDGEGEPAGLVDFDAWGRLQGFEAAGASAGFAVRFGDYAQVDGKPFAHRIEVQSGGVQAELELSDVELDPELAEDMFQVEAVGEGDPSRGQGG